MLSFYDSTSEQILQYLPTFETEEKLSADIT